MNQSSVKEEQPPDRSVGFLPVSKKAKLYGTIAIATAVTLSAVTFAVTRLLPSIRGSTNTKSPSLRDSRGRKSTSEPNTLLGLPSAVPPEDAPLESHDDPKIQRRREAILSKPIYAQPPPPLTAQASNDNLLMSSTSSLDSTSSYDNSTLLTSSIDENNDDDDKLTPTRNLKLYHYYDVEIKGGRGNGHGPGGVPLPVLQKEYEKTGYLGYSSYQPAPDADKQYYKQPVINVKRLSDWNRRYAKEVGSFLHFIKITTV